MDSFLENMCDGVVHCIEGEDEADETCEGLLSFPEEATITCIENRLGYDITIKATPCDGFKECRNGFDEYYCEENKFVLVAVVAGIVILTCGIYHYLKWYQLGWKDENVPVDSLEEGSYCLRLMGDNLANLKVSICKIFINSFLEIHYYF